MVRGLIVSLSLHVAALYVVAVGLPVIPLGISIPEEMDLSIEIVSVEDEALIYESAALGALDPVEQPQLEPVDQGEAPQSPPPLDPIAPEVPPVPQPEPEPEPEQEAPQPAQQPSLLDELNALDELPEVQVPQTVLREETIDDQRLNLATAEIVENDVENVRFDATQEAALGSGILEPPEAIEPSEAEAPVLPQPPAEPIASLPDTLPVSDEEVLALANEFLSPDELIDLLVEGGDPEAYRRRLEELMGHPHSHDTQVADVSPTPDIDAADAVAEIFAPDDLQAGAELEPEAEEAQPQPETTAQPNDDPVDAEAEDAFASVPVPRARPTRTPRYIDADQESAQSRLVAHARIEFPEPEPESQAENEGQATLPGASGTISDALAAVDVALGVTSGAGGGTSNSGAGAGAGADLASGQDDALDQARQAERTATNTAAGLAIRNSIRPDWPPFAEARFGWRVAVQVTLRDIEGNPLDYSARVISSPAGATADERYVVEQAVLGGVAQSFPWRIPQEYVEDWLVPFNLVFCPTTSATTAQGGC